MLLLSSCDDAKPRDHHSDTTNSAPVKQSAPAKPVPSSAIPGEASKTLTHLEEILKTAKKRPESDAQAREAAQAIQKVSAHRTEEACALLVNFLHDEAALIQKNLPSLEDFARAEEEFRRTQKIPVGMEEFASWGWHYRNAAEAARYLVMLDMPEGRRAAYEFRDQLAKKWEESELGKIFLNTVNMELQNTEEDVKTGVVPWKMDK